MKKEIRLERLYKKIEELQDEATTLRLALREEQIKTSTEQPVVNRGSGIQAEEYTWNKTSIEGGEFD